MSVPAGSEIRISYRRPPDRVDVFVNRLVQRTPGVIVTLMEATPLKRPMVIRGGTVLQDGSPVVWFTFPGAGHDLGRFHRADGTFTGIYANMLTPVVFHDESTWETTDLFLDVWLGADGSRELLDEAELDAAQQKRWVTPGSARLARMEAARLLRAAAAGRWPPDVVAEWTLDKARAQVARGTSSGGTV